MSSKDHIWKSEALGKQYLDGVRGAIPFAEEQIEMMLRLVKRECPKVRSFLDLGCGDGILGRALFSRNPDVSGVFLDFSETMIAAAMRKMKPTPYNAVFITQDYSMQAWVEAVREHSPFEVIVSGYSIHHQPDERKREIYGELFSLLSPGGLFLNLEHVASASSLIGDIFDEYFVEALCQYHSRQGTDKTRQQIADDYYHRPDKTANILAPVEEQCRWLRNLGYAHVDCFFKFFELALFGGMKPKPSSYR
jgi:tRNA (cmo5U34)-methyltransferase